MASSTPETADSVAVGSLKRTESVLLDALTGVRAELAKLGITKPQSDAVLGQDIIVLRLKARIDYPLYRDNINTIGDLIGRSERDLLAIDGLGPKAISKIKEKLAKMGLGLKGDPITLITEDTTAAGSPKGDLSTWNAQHGTITKYREDDLAHPIEVLGLEERAYDVLTEMGVRTIGDLIEKTWIDLRQVKRLTMAAFDSILTGLAEMDLRLKDDLNRYIGVLNLSPRTHHILIQNRIRTVNSLVTWYPADMLGLVGAEGLAEVETKLAQAGLSLNDGRYLVDGKYMSN